MSILGRLFGTEKALLATVGGLRDGLDALVYTDEEQAVDAAKDRSEARAMVVDWMDKSKGQNISRRIIALSVTFVWLLSYVAQYALSIVSVFASSGDKYIEAAGIVEQGASGMNPPVMLIMAFYFAAPHMGKFVDSIFKKMGKNG